jgi:hypothetical protein
VRLQIAPDHLCTPVVPHCNEDLKHRRKWKHGNPLTIDNYVVKLVEVRWSENTYALCDHLNLNQYLDVNAYQDGQRPPLCLHITTIPRRLVRRDAIRGWDPARFPPAMMGADSAKRYTPLEARFHRR